MKARRYQWLLACSAAALLSVGGRAAEAADAPAEAGGASATTLGDVIVTARKVSESAQKVPIALTALSGQNVATRNIVRLDDLSSVAPNLYIVNSNNDPTGAQVSIRGLRQPDTLATIDPAVGLYYDGIYLPRNLGTEYLLRNPEEIGQLEVLRGPQGTLFGRNTTGGALTISSVAPGHTVEGYADVTGGNYGKFQAAVGVNIPYSMGGLRVSLEHGTQNGFGFDAAGNPLESENFDRVSARFVFRPTDRLSLDLTSSNIAAVHGAQIQKLLNIAIPGFNVPGTAVNTGILEIRAEEALKGNILTTAQAGALWQSYAGGSPLNGGGTYDQPETAKLFVDGATITANLTDELTLKSITGYIHSSRVGYRDNDSTPYNIQNGHNYQASTQWSEELQLLGKFGPVDGVLGGFISGEKGTDDSWVQALQVTHPGSGTVYDGEVENDSKAVFGQANWHVTHALTFTGGLRYTEDTKQLISLNYTSAAVNINNNFEASGIAIPLPAAPGFACQIQATLLVSPSICEAKFNNSFSNLSWLASVDYQVNDMTLVYGKVTRGFRSGGENIRGNTLAGFTPFAPEEVTQYEAGVKATFLDGRARINADYYYSDYTNIDENVLVPPPVATGGAASTTTINAAKATIDGVEIDATFIPVQHLTLFATFGLIHGKFGSYLNGNVDHSQDPWPGPSDTFDLGGSYVVPLSFGSLTVNGDWNYQSKVFLYGDETQPWCTTQQVGAISGCVRYSIDESMNVYTPAQSLVNARITLHLDEWNADISLWGRNLLNNQQVFSIIDQAGTAGGACTGAGAALVCTINPNAKFGNGFRQAFDNNPLTVGVEVRVKFD